MSNKTLTLILGAFAGLLLFLILITSLTSLSLKKKNTGTPTPQSPSQSSPDQASDFSDAEGSTQSLTPQQEESIYDQTIHEYEQDLRPDEKKLLDELKGELPTSTDDFDIAYSPEINAFVISKKTDKADAAINAFLQSKGLLGLYTRGYGGFLVTNKPINEAITDAEQDIRADIGHGSINTTSKDVSKKNKKKSAQQQAKEEEEKATKPLVDALKSMIDFPKPDAGSTDTASDIQGVTCPPNLGAPNAQGYYQMPPATHGDYEFSNPSCGGQHFGKKELVCTLYTVAQAWMKKYPDSRARIGDLNATGHKSHKWGVAVDFTITNRSAANVSGDRNRSIELGKMFVSTRQIKNIWYNDTAVDNAVMSFARQNNLPLTSMHPIEGHDDHFHVDVNAPRGPVSEPGC